MATIAEMMVSIGITDTNFSKTLDDIQNKTKAMSDSVKKVGENMSKYVTAPIIGAFAGLGYAAMDLEATEAKYNTVFDGMTAQSDAFINEFKKLTPATKSEARNMASGLQDLLVPMGFMREEATDMTGEMMHVVGALANFNSGTHSAEQVSSAMQSALLGQYTSLAALGVQLDVATVKEKAVEMGLADTTDEVTKQHQAQVMIAEVYAQSGDALDAYTEANLDAKTKMGLAKAEIIDVAAEMGNALLPMINTVIDGIRNLTEWFGGLSEENQKTIMIVAAVVAAIGPLLLIIAKIISVVSILTPIVKAAGLAIGGISVPVLLTIAGIAALIAIGVLLYKNWDVVKEKALEIWGSIQEFLTETMDKVKEMFQTAMDWLEERSSGAFGLVYTTIMHYMNMVKEVIKTVWDYIKNTFKNVLDFVKALVKGDFQGMKDAISSQMENVKQLISRIWNSIKSFFSNVLGDIKTAISNKFNEMKNAISEKLNEAKDKAKEIMDNILTSFKEIDLYQIGKDIITGLINGIGSMVSAAATKIKEVAEGIKDAVTGFFGIKSPSRLMMGYGGDIGDGLVVGMDDAEDRIIKQSMSMASAAKPNIEESSGGGGGMVAMLERIESAVLNAKGAIYLDTGALVGGTYNAYDRKGGNVTSLSERWGR